MSELAMRRLEKPISLFLTRAAVRYRDGACVLMEVLREEEAVLRRAGFSPSVISLEREDGTMLEANLWSQDTPLLTDFLNAAFLLFDDEPGSLRWDGMD